MFTAFLRRYRRIRETGERGVALITVMGIGAVLAVMIASGAVLAQSVDQKASSDDNANAALAAAYAGIADYQSRLTNDNTYMQYGNPQAPFSLATGSSSLVLPTGAAANAAFGIGTSGTWQPVAGATGNQAFRYEVDNSEYPVQGIIRVLATGRAGNVTRSILADVRQRGFLDYLYFTNYEVQDPQLTGQDQCAAYKYAAGGVAARPSSCQNIEFQSSDKVDGPMHSNDEFDICGGTFTATVTSSDPNKPITYCDGTFSSAPNVQYEGALIMPPTNQQMKQETLSTASRPSCLYTGPTSITYNSNGTMTVVSPWTKTTYDDGSATKQNPICGTPGTAAGDLGSSTGQTITVPSDNMIFVQNVPTTSTDPNYWPSSGTGSNPSGWTCATNGNDLGYPIANETVLKSNTLAYYGCRNGDAFVKGVVNGQSTVAAENFIWIVGDITYQDPTESVLGLVGQNSIWIWNPVGTSSALLAAPCLITADTSSTSASSSCVNLRSFPSGRTIDAAMLSVAHTVQVQNYNLGSALGNLNVLGAIAQNFRGPVGTVGGSGAATGFNKNYTYDKRLKYIAPPKFLQAVSTTYGVTQYTSVSAGFNADGSAAP